MSVAFGLDPPVVGLRVGGVSRHESQAPGLPVLEVRPDRLGVVEELGVLGAGDLEPADEEALDVGLAPVPRVECLQVAAEDRGPLGDVDPLLWIGVLVGPPEPERVSRTLLAAASNQDRIADVDEALHAQDDEVGPVWEGKPLDRRQAEVVRGELLEETIVDRRGDVSGRGRGGVGRLLARREIHRLALREVEGDGPKALLLLDVAEQEGASTRGIRPEREQPLPIEERRVASLLVVEPHLPGEAVRLEFLSGGDRLVEAREPVVGEGGFCPREPFRTREGQRAVEGVEGAGLEVLRAPLQVADLLLQNPQGPLHLGALGTREARLPLGEPLELRGKALRDGAALVDEPLSLLDLGASLGQAFLAFLCFGLVATSAILLLPPPLAVRDVGSAPLRGEGGEGIVGTECERARDELDRAVEVAGRLRRPGPVEEVPELPPCAPDLVEPPGAGAGEDDEDCGEARGERAVAADPLPELDDGPRLVGADDASLEVGA